MGDREILCVVDGAIGEKNMDTLDFMQGLLVGMAIIAILSVILDYLDNDS